MHELSIAMSIVEMAEEEAAKRRVQVTAIHLKLGALSGVVWDGNGNRIGTYQTEED